MWPEVASPGFVKVDSTDDKQHSTTPLIIILKISERCFWLGLFCRHYLNRSSVLHDLRNLDDCYVDLEYILFKVVT